MLDRRRRRARRDARLAAPRDRRDRAGSVPLLGDRAREHRLRRGPTRPTRRSSSAARLAQAHEFIERLPGRLRHGDRRARHHALGRPAPADRDRARARRRPAHPDPRRRDRVGRRDDRGADPRSACARRCAAGRRSSSPTASRRSRSPTRSSSSTTAASPRAARTTSCSTTSAVYREIYEHGLLEREFAERSACEATAREGLAAGQPPDASSAAREVDDWSWRADAAARSRRSTGSHAPYKLRTALAIVLAARRDARPRSLPPLPREARDRRRHPRRATSTALGWIVAAFVVAGAR